MAAVRGGESAIRGLPPGFGPAHPRRPLADMSDRHVQARSFGLAASTYHAGRPGYPLEAVRWATPSGRRVVDLGAGTGNLTAALLALGRTPVAVEPDPLMLAWLRTTVAGVAAIGGSAEEIPLAGSSVDGVVAGQAAHWFDMHRAVPEMARVLRPGGSLGLIWNRIDPTSPWVIELVAILREANAGRVGHGVDLGVARGRLPAAGTAKLAVPPKARPLGAHRPGGEPQLRHASRREGAANCSTESNPSHRHRTASNCRIRARFGGRFDGSDRIFATDEFSILPLSQSLMRTIG